MRLGFILGLAALSLSYPSLSEPALAQHKNTPPQTQEIPREKGRDDVLLIKAGDPEVNAAMDKAQKTLPSFLTALNDPYAFNFTFKFPLGGTEHIWVKQVRRDGDVLTGVLDNVPLQKGWAKGDAVRVPIAEVSDYFYCDADSKPYGHFTTIVFFDREQGKGFTESVLPQLCEERVEVGPNG